MTRFVSLDPHFFIDPEEEPGEDGLAWLYDAESTRILRCRPEFAEVIGAALEYAYFDVAAIYGGGWGNLTDSDVIAMLDRHAGEHPYVGEEK